jgi:hypothetical protein
VRQWRGRGCPIRCPRHADQIIVEWAVELAAHFGVTVEALRADPTRLVDFPAGKLRIELMDGSYVEFHWAFALINETFKAIAVFTEHCGHHVFPSHEAKVFGDGVLVYEDHVP